MRSGRSPAQERWLRFFNSILYNSLAGLYGALDWLTLGAWWRLVRRALDYVPAGGRVLEIGFGPGRLHTELTQRASLCAGIDLANGMCRLTKHRLAHAGLPVRIVRGSAFALPYPCGTFDSVVSTFTFSGLPAAQAAIREAARVTVPGGQVVLVDIGLPTDGNRTGTFWARLWESMGDYLYDQPTLMKAVGLDVKVFDEFGPGRHIRVIVGQKPAEPT